MGRFVTFREQAYLRDLRRAIESVFDQVTRDVYIAMTSNLKQLSVRAVDAEHVKSFPGAIVQTNRHTASSFVKHFGVNNQSRNQSFRALYYEYGTGSQMRPPAGWTPSSVRNNWNPVRPRKIGADIYFRDGPWVDLGGNLHKGAVRKGVRKKIPRKNVYGHPVRAQFWFQRALKTGTRNLDQLILQAVKSVPVTAYIKLRDVRVRM